MMINMKEDKRRPCKLGTVPYVVWVHGKSKIAAGRTIKVRISEDCKWREVVVNEVQPDGYFQADWA